MRIIGLDPGLARTGWGVIDAGNGRLAPVAAGVVTSDPQAPLAERLSVLHDGLVSVLAAHRPEAAAVEEVFVNKNPGSSLKLGMARGIALLVPAKAGLTVAEYPALTVKKSVAGSGAAGKEQLAAVVRMLLPALAEVALAADATDALAVAITHAHHAQTAAVHESALLRMAGGRRR